MKILVIPDCHLKPIMYKRAAELLRNGVAEIAVSLMDIPDDWKKQFNIEAYEETFNEVIAFAKEFQNTKFCWGNHDLCYLWNERESGYSPIAPRLVCEKIEELMAILPSDNSIKYVQKIDNVLFCHGGLCDYFVTENVPKEKWDDVDAVLAEINALDHYVMWNDASPIWFRPQYYKGIMYKAGTLLQVVGHTPVKEIERTGDIISCDVFSTYQDGTPIGTQEFMIIDTETWKYETVK